MVHVWFCLKDGCENFEKLRLNWISIDVKKYVNTLKWGKKAWQSPLNLALWIAVMTVIGGFVLTYFTFLFVLAGKLSPPSVSWCCQQSRQENATTLKTNAEQYCYGLDTIRQKITTTDEYTERDSMVTDATTVEIVKRSLLEASKSSLWCLNGDLEHQYWNVPTLVPLRWQSEEGFLSRGSN